MNEVTWKDPRSPKDGVCDQRAGPVSPSPHLREGERAWRLNGRSAGAQPVNCLCLCREASIRARSRGFWELRLADTWRRGRVAPGEGLGAPSPARNWPDQVFAWPWPSERMSPEGWELLRQMNQTQRGSWDPPLYSLWSPGQKRSWQAGHETGICGGGGSPGAEPLTCGM